MQKTLLKLLYKIPWIVEWPICQPNFWPFFGLKNYFIYFHELLIPQRICQTQKEQNWKFHQILSNFHSANSVLWTPHDLGRTRKIMSGLQRKIAPTKAVKFLYISSSCKLRFIIILSHYNMAPWPILACFALMQLANCPLGLR